MLHFTALALLLGFELSYYLLIIQTGIVQHFHSDLYKLFPLFFGGMLGTISSANTWGKITNPIHKILIALCLQLVLSFIYPVYSSFTLVMLGLSVGIMAPLSIYLFKEHQKRELFLALAIAYSIGTYGFTSFVNSREWMAVIFTSISLLSAFFLLSYKVKKSSKFKSFSPLAYLPLVLWIFLDSYLFETLSRHPSMNIWSNYTYVIMSFHILGLLAAFNTGFTNLRHHLFIALLFTLSYALLYFEQSLYLAMIYPFAISYYNVIVFITLSKEISLQRLSIMMLFVGWIASGLGLTLALSHL